MNLSRVFRDQSVAPAGALQLSRRAVLRMMAGGAAAAVLPLRHAIGTATTVPQVPPPQGFLTTDEVVILDALTAYIVPTDSQPGARECGVVNYIQSMLSFPPWSDVNCDQGVDAADLTAAVMQRSGAPSPCGASGDLDGNGVIDAADVAAGEAAVFGARPFFAGGPFSGRQPQPHFFTGTTACQSCHTPTTSLALAWRPASATTDYYPPDFFAELLRLPRLQRLSWMVRILGAATVPEIANNPLATDLLEVDLRNKYRTGLAAIEALSQQQFGRPFAQLSSANQGTLLNGSNPDFVTLVTYNTVEGMLCAPEYGGNRNRIGWTLVGFDGDSQPLGYTIYDTSVAGNYRERPDKPNAGPNPDEDCHGFSSGINNFLKIITAADMVQPGRRFSSPYCFEVPG